MRPRSIDELQAASAVGQGKLYQVYDELLRARGVPTAQVLLTFFDMSARTHYLNARQTLRKLLEWRVVPVINENDTTTTDEISFGNNDFLAAQVAILLGAELLVLLTDADGRVHRRPADPTRTRRWSRGERLRRARRAGDRSRHLAARLRRDALEGRRRGDGDRGRDPDGDRRAGWRRARSLAAAAGESVGTRFEAQRGALLELQAVAEVRQARARPGRSSTPAPRGRCARGGRACCRSGSSTSPATSTRATRSRSRTTARAVGKGISNYSAGELRQVRGLKSAAVRELLPGRPRRRSTATTSCWRESRWSLSFGDGHNRHIRRRDCAAAKRASRDAGDARPSGVKDAALEAIAAALIEERADEILEANARDLEAAREGDYGSALLDRLALDRARVAAMAAGVRKIAALPDPVGEVIDGWRLPNGLDVCKVRVPLGVVAVVYEARPNVTIDAAALCLKSGNAIVLRGSSARRPLERACSRGVAARRRRLGAGVPEGALVARRRRRPRGARRARDPDRRRRPDHPARAERG